MAPFICFPKEILLDMFRLFPRNALILPVDEHEENDPDEDLSTNNLRGFQLVCYHWNVLICNNTNKQFLPRRIISELMIYVSDGAQPSKFRIHDWPNKQNDCSRCACTLAQPESDQNARKLTGQLLFPNMDPRVTVDLIARDAKTDMELELTIRNRLTLTSARHLLQFSRHLCNTCITTMSISSLMVILEEGGIDVTFNASLFAPLLYPLHVEKFREYKSGGRANINALKMLQSAFVSGFIDVKRVYLQSNATSGTQLMQEMLEFLSSGNGGGEKRELIRMDIKGIAIDNPVDAIIKHFTTTATSKKNKSSVICSIVEFDIKAIDWISSIAKPAQMERVHTVTLKNEHTKEQFKIEIHINDEERIDKFKLLF